MHSFNLLPWREQRRRRDYYHFSILGLSGIFICLVITVPVRAMLLSRVATLEKNIHHLSKIMNVNSMTLALQKGIADRQLMQKNNKAIIQSLPPDSYLTTLSRQERGWHMEGIAANARETRLFANNLKKTHRFRFITLKSVNKTRYLHFIIDLHD